MDPNLFLELIALVYAVHLIVQKHWTSSVPLIVIAVLLHIWRAWKKNPKHRTPAFVRWLGLPVGVAAGWKAFILIEPAFNYIHGLPLFILSAWAFTEVFPDQFPVMKTEPLPRSKPADRLFPLKALWAIPVVWLLMLLSFYKNYFVTGFFGLAFVVILLVVLRRNRRETQGAPSLSSEWMWLSIVLAVAALFRYPFLNCIFTGFQNDAAREAFGAISAAKDQLSSPFRMGWDGSPTLTFLLGGQVLKLLGTSLSAFRIVSMTVSMLAIFVFNRWCRLYFGPRASLLATVLFAVSWWHLFFAFLTYTVIYTILFEMCAFYFLERGFREGLRRHYWWAGVFTACGVMTYVPGRLVPFMVATFILGCVFFAGRMVFVRTYWKPLSLTFCSFLWLVGPHVRFIVQNPGEFFGRLQELSIFNEVQRTKDYWLPVKTNLWTLISFYWAPGTFADFGVPGHPFIDPLSGLLLLTGLILTFFGLNRRISWAALAGLFFGHVSNSMSIMGQNPSPSFVHGMRMFFMFPFVMILTARGVEWFWEIFDKGSRPMKKGMKAVLVLGLAVCFGFNIYIYYFKFKDREPVWEPLGFHHVDQAKIVNQLKNDCHLVFDLDSYSPIIEYFSDLTAPKVVVLGGEWPIPILNQVTKDVALFTHTWKMVKTQEEISKYYPHATVSEYKNPWGNVYLRVIRIPKADIEAGQKGRQLTNPLP